MKLTNEDIDALEASRMPVSVYGERAMTVLRRLADLGLVEVGQPMAWQKMNPDTCPLGIAVITAAGRRALNLEACHAG
ncbi:MAG: hypothetical protein GX595_12200 [Lentisphaerae bacterium]|nr:hypothetical protein [Lentisphaerota bacterium]